MGYDLALNYARDAAAAGSLAAELRAAGVKVITVQADVADAARVARMFERVDAELGPLTALVNNAGIVAPSARLDAMTPERWRRVFDVNVIGTLLCCQQAARRMSTQGRRRHADQRAGARIDHRKHPRQRCASGHHRDRNPCGQRC